MLDEPSIQLSWNVAAHLDRANLQNLSGVLEPRKPGTKHRADFAGSRLAIEMDRFTAGGDWRVHDVLSPAVPKTNRRRTDHAFSSKANNKSYRSGSYRGNYTLDPALAKRSPQLSSAGAIDVGLKGSRASDPDPNQKDQHSSDDHLKCCAEKWRIHIALSDPADDQEFDCNDHNSNSRSSSKFWNQIW